MRRLTKLSAVVAIAALALAGCGGSDNEGGDSASVGDDICKTAEGDGPRIALAYDVGGRGDKSFNDSVYAGVERAVAEFGATCIEAEAVDEEPESAREDRLRNLAENDATAVIGVGYGYSDSVNAVAPDFPEVNFAVIDGFDPDEQTNPNVAYLGFPEEQGSFLVGVAAAEKTKTGTIGFVGGVNNELVRKFEAGYTAGAKTVKPDVKVEVQYIQESDVSGFDDTAGGKAAATGAFDKGADIVYHAAGDSGAGVFDAAVEAGEGNWAIGVDSDQYVTATKAQQPYVLTSMLKGVDIAMFDFARSIDEGSPIRGSKVYDLAAGGVGYSTSGGFIDDIVVDLDDYRTKIINGEIKVPTTP